MRWLNGLTKQSNGENDNQAVKGHVDPTHSRSNLQTVRNPTQKPICHAARWKHWGCLGPNSSSGDLTWAGRFADWSSKNRNATESRRFSRARPGGGPRVGPRHGAPVIPPPPVGNGGDTPSVIAPNPRGGGRGRTSDCRFAGFWSAREVCAQRRCSGPPRISQMRPMFHPSASWQRKAPPKRS